MLWRRLLRSPTVATAAATAAAGALYASCEAGQNKLLGRTGEGRPIYERTLVNGSLRVRVMDFGATITSVVTPDADVDTDCSSSLTAGADAGRRYRRL